MRVVYAECMNVIYFYPVGNIREIRRCISQSERSSCRENARIASKPSILQTNIIDVCPSPYTLAQQLTHIELVGKREVRGVGLRLGDGGKFVNLKWAIKQIFRTKIRSKQITRWSIVPGSCHLNRDRTFHLRHCQIQFSGVAWETVSCCRS